MYHSRFLSDMVYLIVSIININLYSDVTLDQTKSYPNFIIHDKTQSTS